ncbi:MAG TPA: tetratricopeptide repeat protein [Bacteroidota bacterium]|nr:tetratricopeptide repeat protein [Bacteroidota bacterium]
MAAAPPPPDRTPGFARIPAWSIILLAGAAIFLRTVSYDFVTYDDQDLIVQNSGFLSHGSNVFTAFTTHVFAGQRAEASYYRPLLMVSFIADYQIWKLAPGGYHGTNVLLHLAVGWMVTLLLFRLTRSRGASLAGGLFFLLHPVQTETVAWISGRNDLLLALFVTAAIHLFVLYRENPQRSWLFAGSAAAFTAALFTKESAVFYLLLLPAYDLCFTGTAGGRKPAGKKIAEYFVFALLTAAYLVVRGRALGVLGGFEQFEAGTTLWDRLAAAPGMFAEHLALIVYPLRLSVAHPVSESFWLQPQHLWIAAVVTLGAIGLGWRACIGDRGMRFGLLWAGIGFLPLLNIIPVAVPVLEHRLYLPMAGLAICLAGIAARLFGMPRRRTAAASVMGGLIAACAVLTILRLPVWNNSETLLRDAIRKAPSYSRSYFNLAGYYYEHQQFDSTIGLMKTYVGMRPDDPMGYVKLRQTYFAAGKYADAGAITRLMINRAPGNPDRYIEAAELYMEANRPDSVLAIYEEGIAAVPASYLLHDLAGRACVRLRMEKEAERHYRKAIEINPLSATAYFDLGSLCASQGDSQNAIAEIEAGMRMEEPPGDLVQLLYQLYRETHQDGKADALRKKYSGN